MNEEEDSIFEETPYGRKECHPNKVRKSYQNIGNYKGLFKDQDNIDQIISQAIYILYCWKYVIEWLVNELP